MGILGFGALASYREINEEKSFVMGGVNEIQVNMTSIPVHIIRTEAGSEVKFHLHGKAKRGVELIATMSNTTIVAEEKHKFDGLPIEAVLLDVYIPEDYVRSLVVNTASGIVKVDSINLAAFTLNTSSGGLEAEKLAAEKIIVNTTSGDLNIKESGSKELKIKGTSSDIQISYCEFDNQNLNIKTTSGNITLELPSASEFSYEIANTGGKFKSDFLINTSENIGKRNIEGQIGNRNNKISLQASSGNIAIIKK